MIQGCIGAIEFSVSPLEVFTWRNMERKSAARFGEHAVLEGVPRLQHTGRELDTVTLAVMMDGGLANNMAGELARGVKKIPTCEQRIAALRELAATGEEQPLVFGAAWQGLWVITAVSVTARVMQGSRILRADVSLELKEYN